MQKSQPLSNNLTECDWAWLAGLFEGEGCVGIDNRPGRMCGSLVIRMTDEDTIQRVYDKFGGRMLQPTGTKPNRKPAWQWAVSRRDHVTPIIYAVLPYMSARRTARMNELLAVYSEKEIELNSFNHGTRRGYDRFGCRCKECLKYNAKRARDRRKEYQGNRDIVVSCIECRRSSSFQSFVVHYRQMHDQDSKAYKYKVSRSL